MSGQEPIYDPVTEDDAQVYVDMLLERQRIHGERDDDYDDDEGQRWSAVLEGGRVEIEGTVPWAIVAEIRRRGFEVEPVTIRGLAELLVRQIRIAPIGEPAEGNPGVDEHGWELSFSHQGEGDVIIGRGDVPIRYERALISCVVHGWMPEDVAVYWFIGRITAAPIEGRPGAIQVEVETRDWRRWRATYLHDEYNWLELLPLGGWKSRPMPTIYWMEFGTGGYESLVIITTGDEPREAMASAGDYLLHYAPGVPVYATQEQAWGDFEQDEQYAEQLEELDPDDDTGRWDLWDEFMSETLDLAGDGQGPWVNAWEFALSDQRFDVRELDPSPEIVEGLSRAVLLAGYIGWLHDGHPDWPLRISDAL